MTCNLANETDSALVLTAQGFGQAADQAKEQLLQRHRGLVWMAVKGRKVGPAYDREDLEQCGKLGLLKAIERYDPTNGARFSTYAVPWIRGEIQACVESQGRAIRLPGHIMDDLSKVHRTREDFEKRTGREATIGELASGSGLKEARVETLLGLPDDPLSLDASWESEEGDLSLGDTVESSDRFEAGTELAVFLAPLLDGLADRQRFVVKEVILRERFLTEVAAALGITPQSVFSLQRAALKQLRNRIMRLACVQMRRDATAGRQADLEILADLAH